MVLEFIGWDVSKPKCKEELSDLIKSSKLEQKLGIFTVLLTEREPRKALEVLKDLMRDNSSWKAGRNKELVKAKDLADHYSKLFKGSEVGPTQP